MIAPFNALWRDDLDALQFIYEEPDHKCLVHRLAFKSLLGKRPDPQNCMDYYSIHAGAFLSAALKKTARTGQSKSNIHINSRDVARLLAEKP